MISHDNLSDSEFPLPVVLVVGDMTEYFAERAWEGVTAKHLETGPSFPAIEWTGASRHIWITLAAKS